MAAAGACYVEEESGSAGVEPSDQFAEIRSPAMSYLVAGAAMPYVSQRYAVEHDTTQLLPTHSQFVLVGVWDA